MLDIALRMTNERLQDTIHKEPHKETFQGLGGFIK